MSAFIKPISCKQQGVYTVEFAIVGGLFFMLLFAVIEVGRLLYTWNVLTEISRRTARLAVVCNPDEDNRTNLKASALFNNNSILSNFTIDNVAIDYIKAPGTSVITMVQASITNYQHQLLIPGISLTINSPDFTTVLPRESLGATRNPDVTTVCAPSGT